jgi:outer membrane protein assembly factor BamB
MSHFSQGFIVGALLLTFAAGVAAQPVITSINSSELPRSGRIAIEGSGFGSGGQVSVAGLAAWTTTWTDTRVVAYVPEAAPLGAASVHVVALGQQSNEVDLTVTARQSSGRVKWTFEADWENLWWRPALAPDGTIYLHGSHGFIYALSPDGALLWTQKVVTWPYVPPTAGPDGALYVGSIGYIYRISPGGAIDWQYNPEDGVNIEVSPTVGPDGLLYGAFEVSGAFAIEPLTGDLVWSNPGQPMITDKAGQAVEARFGPAGPDQPVDQLYISVDGGGNFHTFSLDGDQLFTAGLWNVHGTAEAAIGSDGTIYGPRGLGLTVVAIDPSDGSTLWQYYPSDWAVGTNNVEIGPDDMLYFVGSSAKLEAFDPHTQSRKWQEFTISDSLGRPSVTPDGATLIVTGADHDFFGNPGFVKAFDTRNGHERWRINLPFQLDPGFRVHGIHHARITPDSRTAYISTYTLAEYPLGADPHTFLYAIDIEGTGGGDPPPDPCDYDGACELGEDCLNCASDCPGQSGGKPANRWCCGDGVCSDQEDGSICSLDCGPLPVCGDGVCSPGEDPCACADDCEPEASELPGWTCADGLDNDCDGAADCGDPDCAGDPACEVCTLGGKNATCSSDADCCSGVCKGNGRCR